MAKIEILVLEDDKLEIELIKSVLDENYIVYFAQNGKEAIELLEKKNGIDIAILDIYIEGKNEGIEVAEYIGKSQNLKCPFIFLTSANDRATFDNAKNLSPASFLLKPFNQLELIYAMELAIENSIEDHYKYSWESSNGAVVFNQNFLIKKRDVWVKIAPSEVLFIEVEGRYCNLITDKGKFLVQSSLSKILKALDKSLFIQTHRNYLVNIARVKEFRSSDNLIVMDNDKSVFLSSRSKEAFLKHYHLL
jgi:DNA-binding LytR/AlgR family response regulator